jgi:hypothetical protein
MTTFSGNCVFGLGRIFQGVLVLMMALAIVTSLFAIAIITLWPRHQIIVLMPLNPSFNVSMR